MKKSWRRAGLAALVAAVSTTCCPSLQRPALISKYSYTPTGFPPVEYSPKALNNIRFLYNNITNKPDGVEYALCLYGEINERKIRVNDTDLPAINRAVRDSVYSESCTKTPTYLGRFHSHPVDSTFDNCYLSTTDWETFLNDKNASISGLACQNNVIKTFYRPANEDSMWAVIKASKDDRNE